MTAPIGRICLLLASADLSLSEVRNFARWVEKNRADRVVATIERLRQIAEDDYVPIRPDLEMRRYQSGNANKPSEISTKVERLACRRGGANPRARS